MERTGVRLGRQSRTWYLTVTDHIKDGLRRLQRSQLFGEKPRELRVVAWVRNSPRYSGEETCWWWADEGVCH